MRTSQRGISRKLRDAYFGDKTKPSHPLPVGYMEELERIWGKNWGAQSEIGKLREALVYVPGKESAPPTKDKAWYHYRVIPNWRTLRREIEGLVEALKKEHVRVNLIDVPKSLAVRGPYGVPHARLNGRDPGIVVNGGAIVGRPALPYKRGDQYWWAKTVMGLGCPILYTVHGNGTFEDGNVIWLDETHVCIGRSAYTNQEGIDQVAVVLRTVDPPVEEVRVVPIPGWLNNLEWPAGGFAHLDMVFGYVDDGVAIVYPPGVPYDFLEYLREKGVNLLEVPPDEAKDGAPNVVALAPGKILLIARFNKTRRLLEAEGVDVIPVDLKLFGELGAGPHCKVGALIRDRAPKL